jgi:IclR family transcriptional regulator, KDG regulon repressor
MESEFQFHREGRVVGANLTVTKALDVLDLLGQAEQGLRLKDIALRLGLPESTTHRLLTSLAARGYVQQREDHGLYQLGWKIVVLADALGSGARLVETMRPYLQRLVRDVGQTINLAVLSNDQVMYLDCQTPINSLSLYVAPGLTLPAHATSLGKVLLAHLPPAELDAALARLPFTPLTPNTISTPAAFREALTDVRQQGYALDLGELRPDVNCLAVPILDATGRARAAVSMTAPSAELPADWQVSFPPRLMTVAAEASARSFGAQELLTTVA